MKTAPIVEAHIEHDANGTPFAPAFGDVYHPRGGALAQARHVFLAGNGLPARWAQRDRFVVLETGFGLGNNFLATWDAWRADPQRCERLVFISIERHPPRREDLRDLHRDSPLRDLAGQLVEAWPPATWNLHRLSFEAGRVQLLLCFGDVAAWLPEIVARVDAFFLDGFAPARNPQMWEARLFKSLARLAAPQATAATWSAARAVRDGLSAAGFEVMRADGIGGKRDITTARFAPRFEPRGPLGRMPAPNAEGERRALIVGGGLAGCSIAAALAECGWHCDVFDRHAAPAREASGNAGGLFHGVVHPEDGAHARFHRAASLHTERIVREAIALHGVRGQVDGLLRLENRLGLAGMQRLLGAHGLPPGFVTPLDAGDAAARAGVPLSSPAWFFPGGGWVEPAGLANAWLQQAHARVRWRGRVSIERLEATSDGWRLVAADGSVLDEAATVVLANAGDAMRLLGDAIAPLTPVRGQIGALPLASLRIQGIALPRIPVAGAGYVLPPIGDRLWFGATATPGDAGTDLRLDDHRANLAQLEALLKAPAALPASPLAGRAAVRWSTDDRLPLMGAAPAAVDAGMRLDQPRFVPRRPGLFVFTALGSRGIVSSSFGAQVLAAWIAGAPVPLEAGLLDAVDPARFVSRLARRASR